MRSLLHNKGTFLVFLPWVPWDSPFHHRERADGAMILKIGTSVWFAFLFSASWTFICKSSPSPTFPLYPTLLGTPESLYPASDWLSRYSTAMYHLASVYSVNTDNWCLSLPSNLFQKLLGRIELKVFFSCAVSLQMRGSEKEQFGLCAFILPIMIWEEVEYSGS